MAGGQSVNYCDSVFLAFRLIVLWCAQLHLGITEDEVQSWRQGTNALFRMMFSEFQSWGKLGWGVWSEPLGGGLNAQAVCDSAAFLALWVQCALARLFWVFHTRRVKYKVYWFGVFGVTWDFDLAGWYSSILKSQDKHNAAVAVYSWIQIQMWCPFLVAICCHSAGHLQSLRRNMQIEASSSALLSSKFTLLVV